MRQPTPCLRKAMDLLSRRPHFRRELEAKLAQRDYDPAEIEETLERLEARRLLDDARTTLEFVSSRLAREPLGRRRLRNELERRGAPPELARQALDELFPEDETELARQAAERWRRRRGGAAPRDQRAALFRHLERRGFSQHAIFSVLQGMPAQASVDQDDFPTDDFR
ncbi:MAG: regulatory protein RecX [bacterium]|nr:regulatory protein RecX [bacterium]